MFRRVDAREVGLEPLQLRQPGGEHGRLAVADDEAALVVAVGAEVERLGGQGADLAALVDRDALDQALLDRQAQVEVHHDVGEVPAGLLSRAGLGVRGGGEVDLGEPVALGGADLVEGALPLEWLHDPAAAYLVHVVGLVVEDEQVGQVAQPRELEAASRLPVEPLEAVAGGGAGHHGQEALGHGLHVRGGARGGDLGLVLVGQEVGDVLVSPGEQVPVGDRDDAARGGASADLRLVDGCAAHELQHALAVPFGDEQRAVRVQVAGVPVALAGGVGLAEEGVEQPVVDDQARGDDEEVAGEPAVARRGEGVEVLPDEQGVEHPRLAGAGRQFDRVLRVPAAVGVDLGAVDGVEVGAAHPLLAEHFVVQVGQRGRAEHLVAVDHGEDGVPLSVVEVRLAGGGAGGDAVLVEPPVEQLGGDRGHPVVEQVGLAVAQVQGGLGGLGGDAADQRQAHVLGGQGLAADHRVASVSFVAVAGSAGTCSRRSDS